MTGEHQLLTERMRMATKAAHSRSDLLVVLRLAVALTSRQLYGECIGWFYMVFKAFEASIDASRKNEHVTKLHQTFDQLRRTEAFEADLKFYLGQDQWKDKLTVPAAVESYISHINMLEKEDPLLLLVYFFHFMGALSAGGATIKKMVSRTLGLQGKGGTSIFEFGGGLKFKDVKDAFNSLSLTTDEEDRVLAESVKLFERNNEVVNSLKQGMTWANIASTLKSAPVQIVAAVVAVIAIASYYLRRD